MKGRSILVLGAQFLLRWRGPLVSGRGQMMSLWVLLLVASCASAHDDLVAGTSVLFLVLLRRSSCLASSVQATGAWAWRRCVRGAQGGELANNFSCTLHSHTRAAQEQPASQSVLLLPSSLETHGVVDRIADVDVAEAVAHAIGISALRPTQSAHFVKVCSCLAAAAVVLSLVF
jgi:hypothetical protein